ncbi:leucine-rich repeat domain-containing protein [Neochlamydia sp. S13]|uniref:leucine-rich repeat domain-containing protein n=1 Tax=Neochlamydia sp. S13 TaxID=1353976 RepID=UPI00069340DF|nr:leucine-rich repeat domain-containing protein [Neochlamydia sp. S13]BBI17659.1 Leucine rich repeat protein [Neochlamydia sp. S13]
MNPSSSTTIEHLPNEILVPILKACASPPLFSVCRRWYYLLANEVMPSFYKQIGKVHVPQGNIEEQSLILEKIYKLEEELSETAKVDAIFKQTFALASSLSPLELEFKWITEEKRYFTLANYSSYLLNINRLLMCKRIPDGYRYLNQEAIKYLPLKEKGKLFSNWIERYGKDITSLNLRGIGLTFLPPEIGQLSQLQKLDLNNNQLTTLPAEIGQLSQLKELKLEKNQLASLPPEIGQLSQLPWLKLESNQLTTLPAKIGQLSQLRMLYLNNNQLTSLPAEIKPLSQLRALNLQNN